MYNSYMRSIKEKCNTVVSQRKEQSRLFVVGARLSLRGHMVMSSQSVPGEEKSMDLETILSSCVATRGWV